MEEKKDIWTHDLITESDNKDTSCVFEVTEEKLSENKENEQEENKEAALPEDERAAAASEEEPKKKENKVKKFLKENGVFLIVLFTILYVNLNFPKYFIQTGSMAPALNVGAIVFVDPDRDPKVADIAAYKSGSNIIIHRVMSKTDEGYTFKGDANTSADAAIVPEEDIEGTVIIKLNFVAPVVKRILHLTE